MNKKTLTEGFMPDYITDNMAELMDGPVSSLSSNTPDHTFPPVVEKVIILIECFTSFLRLFLFGLTVLPHPPSYLGDGGSLSGMRTDGGTRKNEPLSGGEF